MIVDTSALLAVIFRERGFEELLDRLGNAEAVAAGSPTLAETGIVLQARIGQAADGVLERVLDEFAIEEIPFGSIHWREAVDAYRQWRKGRHEAGLNFGDCMTYAVARLAGEPLLYMGGDFAHTDVDPA